MDLAPHDGRIYCVPTLSLRIANTELRALTRRRAHRFLGAFVLVSVAQITRRRRFVIYAYVHACILSLCSLLLLYLVTHVAARWASESVLSGPAAVPVPLTALSTIIFFCTNDSLRALYYKVVSC